MKRQWQYECKASLALTPLMQPLNVCRCNITYSGCSSAPCTPAPKRGTISCGTSITHSPQRPVPQNRTKTPPCLWRRWPRPLLSVNGAGRGLRLSIQSRVRGGLQTACSKKKKKEKIFWTRSALIKCDVLKLGVKIEAKIYLDYCIFFSLNRLSCMLCCIHWPIVF